ncbi:alpha/beta fold hydrolase [Sphaerisporangium aureirubrum]|uniref:Alpha/beta fold hydrolase n=1 Tax=Sphaerisporangium aureirubrum TaxID=1544736 RepID=A0ABW1NHX5_9ACTN
MTDRTGGAGRPRSRFTRTALAVALTAAVSAFPAPAAAAPSGPVPAPARVRAATHSTGDAAGSPAAGRAHGAAGTSLRWTACAGVDDPALRCASVRVPLDHRRPHWRAISIAISRLPATDPARRRGVLLTTGGGPGGPGVPLPVSLAPFFSGDVRARYDLIGFDIRFAERSTPIGCGQPAEEPGGFWVRTARQGSLPADAAAARRYAEDCVRAAGWALPHATTANAARDMDLIRAALGEERISYIGGSSAGMLGAAYGTLFPHRVDRFVLDSPVYGDIAWRAFELSRTPAMEAGMAAFAAWTAERDSAYALGGTPAEVTAAVTRLLDRAASAPIVIAGHPWTAGELGYLLVAAVYYDRYFGLIAAALSAVAAGREPFVPFPIRPAPPDATVPVDNHTATSTAYRCADGPWPRDPRAYRRDLDSYTRRHPLFGPANANITPCAFWPRPEDGPVSLRHTRAPGALVLAALRDAAVPPDSSRAVAARIRGSRLVTVDAQTHAPFPYQGDPCVNGAVNDYLATGVLPPADVAC